VADADAGNVGEQVVQGSVPGLISVDPR
jgi:hypothetical protein